MILHNIWDNVKVFIDIIANNKNNTFNGDVSIKGTDVNVGDIVNCYVYDIDLKRQKVSLSLINPDEI